ncbi:glutamate-5-semialdehyde dehydrogenase [Suttonella sp. R2A3]|uniref:glutamate-5-semialdehyde dehydrogenase n=1 Tax=Suttonella sp. R2A3 TaxID=2908648 RepID=UPI001F454069|nr:glutamate-5-semialdehyde dehydrogenase [Suttonella sp. R2A3]UJF23872.1 glutamate-5-semialdehyde dehydrogenase [Suttonella sp. R2A3]
MSIITTLGEQAQRSARSLAILGNARKREALEAMAGAIDSARANIQSANQQDVAAGQEKGLSEALLDRLTLTDARIDAMIDGIRQIAGLPDPVGEISGMRTNDKGLQIGRMRVPLGVIGIIYESRPNVTADAAALCLKSGNAAILRGGSEAIHSNRAIMAAIQEGLSEAELSPHAIQLVPDTDRALVSELLNAAQYIDVVIPRGGKGLVQLVSEQAKMPVIKHLDGLCHTYIDVAADLEKALRVADNAKTYRYGICGATETLLVHQNIAADFLPKIAEIYRKKGVEMRGCSQTQALINEAHAANEDDWSTEYLAPIIAIKIVLDYEAACAHIARYGSRHTECIVTEQLDTAQRFLREVDAASVMVNTPTCFSDGYEYGLGAEIGISTDKIHWRGPVGVEGLTCQKFIVLSDGVTR